jgi:ATP-dependent RNA helicase DeaD
MLNMGFIDDIEEILKHTPENKQILLFSATMPKAIKNLAVKYLKNYDEVKIERKELTNPNIEQKHFKVDEKNKFDALCRILEIEPDFYGIVFCKTKADVDEVSSKLVQK